MSFPPHLTRIASRCAQSDLVRTATEPSVQSVGEQLKCRVSSLSRLQTQFKDEVASVHSCDDEGKEDDRRDDMHRASCSCDGASVTERGGAVLGQ